MNEIACKRQASLPESPVHVATVTEHHRRGGLKTTEMCFSQFRALGRSRPRCWQIWCLVSCESLLPRWQTAVFSLCPHMVRGARPRSGISFIRTQIPFLRAPLSWPNHLPKAHLPMPSHCALGFQQVKFGGIGIFSLQQFQNFFNKIILYLVVVIKAGLSSLALL